MTGGKLLSWGLGAIIAAVLGWVATFLAGSALDRPDGVEDLTAAWNAAGDTPLGEATTVTVPPEQTLVAFLVGTDLVSIAGTTTGDCRATADGRSVDLDWPVQIDPSLSGILSSGQQVVAIAGWANTGADPADVEITCSSGDSTVDHFVAVPSRTATLPSRPWFQPWGWVALGSFGAVAVAIGVSRGIARGAG